MTCPTCNSSTEDDATRCAMCGTEFLAKIACQHPNVIRIMLTGKPNLEVAQGAINNGGVHKFLTKPCDAATLANVIKDALGRDSVAK